MRILHISRALPPNEKGGQEKCIMKIINYFQEKFDLLVFVKKGKTFRANYRLETFDPKINPNNIFQFIKNFIDLIKKSDLIHFHYPVPFFPEIPVIPIFLLINFFLKKKYIVHIHVMTKFDHFLWKIFGVSLIFKSINKLFFQKSEKILTPTNFTLKFINLNYRIPIKKIVHVPYGVSEIFFNINLNKIRNNNKKIIFVGRLHPSKRVNKIITAIIDLPENYYLEIYGDGEEFNYLKKISEESERIKFYGYIAEEKEILKAYENADLMVLPSLNEEMPLSILEALASRVPVLCSNLPSIVSEYRNNINYIRDIEYLKKDIFELTHQYSELSLNEGRQFALNYVWENNFKKIQDIYNAIFNENN